MTLLEEGHAALALLLAALGVALGLVLASVTAAGLLGAAVLARQEAS